MRAALIAIIVVSLLGARPLRAQEEQEHQGGAVESAVARLLDPTVPRSDVPEAIAAAVMLGPKVGKELVERYLEVTVAEAGQRWHREDTGRRDRRVLAVLRGLGRGAEPALARLIAETKTAAPETRDAVWQWIFEIGPWVPYLNKELRALEPPEFGKQEWDIWEWADWERFQVGLEIGPDAPVERLIEILGSGDCLAIEFVAEVLVDRGPSAAEALEPLATALARSAQEAVLVQTIRGKTQSMTRAYGYRWLLEDAIAAIAPGDVRALPGLQRRLDRSHALEVRIAAARALGGLADAGDGAVRALAGVCSADEDPRLVAAALAALGALGPETAAVPEGMETLAAFDDADLWGAELAGAAHEALDRVRER